MPRKRPDLTPFYPDKKDRIDGVAARTPYFSEYSYKTVWAIKDRPEKQRMVKCQGCKTIIPRNIPRVWLEAAFRYSAGHYCMSCARDKLKETQDEFKSHMERVQHYVDAIDNVLETSDKIVVDQRYIDALAMGRMISVIRGKDSRERQVRRIV